MRAILSDRLFLNKIVVVQQKENIPVPLENMQPNSWLISRIDKIINKIAPKTSCMVRSLVKRKVLKKAGINSIICFGIAKDNDVFRAHSWISIEKNTGFAQVYQVS